MIELFDHCTTGSETNIMRALTINPPYCVWEGLEWYAFAMNEARRAYTSRVQARLARNHHA